MYKGQLVTELPGWPKCYFSQSTGKESAHETAIQPERYDRSMLPVSFRRVRERQVGLHTQKAAVEYATHLANRC